MKKTALFAVAAALALSSCSSSTDGAGSGAEASPAPAELSTLNTPTGNYVKKAIGESGGVVDPDTGLDRLAFTVHSIRPVAQCANLYDEIIPGEYIETTMTVATNGLDFADMHIMRGENWSVADGEGVNHSGIADVPCEGNVDLLSLEEVGTRDVTFYLRNPGDPEALRLNAQNMTQDLSGWEWPIPVAAEPEAAPVHVQPTPAAVPTSQAPAPAAPRSPVGFTGAPVGEPTPLVGKVIDYCMDGSMYQNGTTQFTDGTTGWTTECAG